jgi:hypothetical protein
MHRIGLLGALVGAIGGAAAHAGEIDHVIVAAPSLEAGDQALAARTGIRTVFGGVHVAGDTANHLASLGEGRYLELLGPAPGRAPFGEGMALTKLDGLHPLGFAVRVKDAEAEAARLLAAGLKVSAVQPGGRTTPQGARLNWKTFAVDDPEFCSVLPFFIEWGADTPHPSTTSPAGAELVRLRVVHPRAEALARLFETMGVPVKPEAGPARLEIALKGPRGEASFSGTPDCGS